jgi:hypothetical protein
MEIYYYRAILIDRKTQFKKEVHGYVWSKEDWLAKRKVENYYFDEYFIKYMDISYTGNIIETESVNLIAEEAEDEES